jgi:DNA-binding NarL/FixJ family response regulator
MAPGINLSSIAIIIGLLNMFGCKGQSKNLMGHGEKVLIIGRHADMLTKITDMLKQHGYNSIGKMTNEDAILVFKADTIDAVIIGGGVDAESRDLFHKEFPKINPKVKIIDAHPQTVLSDLKAAFPDKL